MYHKELVLFYWIRRCLVCFGIVDLEDKVNVQNLIKSKAKFCRLCDSFVYDSGFRKRKCDIPFLAKEDYFSIKVGKEFLKVYIYEQKALKSKHKESRFCHKIRLILRCSMNARIFCNSRQFASSSKSKQRQKSKKINHNLF